MYTYMYKSDFHLAGSESNFWPHLKQVLEQSKYIHKSLKSLFHQKQNCPASLRKRLYSSTVQVKVRYEQNSDFSRQENVEVAHMD